MAIQLRCPKCGQGLRLKEHCPGKRLVCPRCKATITAPDNRNESSRSPATRVCRACGRKLEPTALLCVSCGTNQKTGKQLRGAHSPPEGGQESGHDREGRPSRRSGAWPWLLGTGVGLAVVGVVIVVCWRGGKQHQMRRGSLLRRRPR